MDRLPTRQIDGLQNARQLHWWRQIRHRRVQIACARQTRRGQSVAASDNIADALTANGRHARIVSCRESVTSYAVEAVERSVEMLDNRRQLIHARVTCAGALGSLHRNVCCGAVVDRRRCFGCSR